MIVYKITSRTTGKVYIGVTIRKFDERMRNHKNNKSKTKFYNAIRKYGWEDFDKEIIEQCDNLQDLFYKEIYWIEQYNSYKSGYNSTPGGDVSPMLFEYNKAKLSQTKKKQLNTKTKKLDQVKRLQEYNNIHGNPRVGTKHSDEAKKKISDSKLGIKLSKSCINKIIENSPNRIEIDVYENDKFVCRCLSIRQAEKELKIKRDIIKKCLEKNMPFDNKYRFKRTTRG